MAIKEIREYLLEVSVLLGLCATFSVSFAEYQGYINIISLNRPIGFVGFAQAFGAAASVVFSLLLVRIYSRQTDIMSSQHALRKQDRKTNLIVEEWKPKGDKIEFSLSNSGRGAVHNLRLVLLGTVVDTDGPEEVEINNQEMPSHLNREDERRISRLEADEYDIKYSVDVVLPGESAVQIPIDSDPIEDFSTVVSRLKDDYDLLWIHPILRYENSIPDDDTQIWSDCSYYLVPLDEEMTFEEALENGRKSMPQLGIMEGMKVNVDPELLPESDIQSSQKSSKE